ncbi:YbfB/YjiJ family MFS transporter [Paraburkholderia rhizosphaerae]|uniref:Putative MFS family arabinose efflux permease n=1 Tax=Paraburkholderia rhizosphaerae TaxID=480658 RepID=A0A4R8L811_9BURK|nr:YbfB/YjiJ family MFS transporter [Paraburkholderia rhizosphaerae]TDY38831.1 putative MFS family arabinose efflux permease [Paraburkholderia rhizosphaerae]
MEKTIGSTRGARTLEAVAGALVLAIGMGFGRFSFTGMYPLMVRDGVIDVTAGSVAASANYAGYLLGAILMSRFKHHHAARLCQLSMIGTIACLAVLSLHLPESLLATVRFVAGVVSAMAMVGASIWLLHVVGQHHGAPLLFAGVGVGIVVSAEIIAIGAATGLNSAALWALLAAAALLLSALAWPRLGMSHADTASQDDDDAHADRRNPHRSAPNAYVLVALYGLAGFGYIVTATYLPLLVKDTVPGINPVHIWAAFGIGAVPSCFLWHWLNQRLGSRRAIALNLLVQAVGVVLPALVVSASSFLASAVLVGGTFVGTVTIAMPVARQIASTVRFNVMATMTAAYGVGQILGPLVSSALFARTHSFDAPLVAAGASLVLAAALACK